MYNILFTTTFFICIALLLRAALRRHISARLQYAVWLLVAVKLLVFPMPDAEGEFSVLGLAAQDSREEFLGEHISAEELAAAQAGGIAQERAQGGQTAAGDLWADSDQGMENTVAGTDTGVTPEYVGIEGKQVSRLGRWYRMTKLRLVHYVDNVWKVPVWFAGILGTGSLFCAVWMMVCHVRLWRYLRQRRVALSETKMEEVRKVSAGGGRMLRTYSVEGLPTPCLFGRRVYIPADLAEDSQLLPCILRHEMCHYFHGDTVWGLVRMICVCLYWYHPLVWLAAYLSRQDCELACDEAAVRLMDGQERRRYGELLLRFVPVKGFPADCFSMTTTMSGNAKNLKQRLERITAKRKNTVILGVLAAAAGLAGLYACVTSGFVSVDKQWQSIRIRQEEESVPILQESYRVDYRLSRDAASYGLYLEQYKYGELVGTEVLDCQALRPEGGEARKQKKGEVIYSRSLESDAVTGAFVKSVNSYSVPDYTTSDGPESLFRAFTLDLSETTAVGNSFSMAVEEKLEHRFRLGEDIILLASYYGDGMLTLPPKHIFEAEKFMEKTGEIWESDSCVMLVHLIVSDRPAEELRRQLDGTVGAKSAEPAAQADGYSNEELLKMAENFYRREHGYAPAHVEIDSEDGEEVLIWLYDRDEFMNGENEIVGSARTGDWYTVNRMTGKGENVLLEEIDLTQTASLTVPWDGKIEEMTVEDIREEERFSALPAEPGAGAERKLYLLGETENYRLYGAGDYQSMILADQDSLTEVSMPFITDGITMMAPEVQEADYDGDGVSELAVKLVKLFYGEDTGVWQEQLWMFDREEGQVKICEYPGGAYAEELLRRLSFEERENGKVIALAGRQISPELREEQGVSYENMGINITKASFAFADGTIKLRIPVSCGSREGSAMPAYGDGCLEAEVLYDGSRFFIRDVGSADLKDAEKMAGDAVRAFYAPRGIEIIDGNAGQWRLSEETEQMEMTLTVLERGQDSYDYATVLFVREETGQWAVTEEVWVEK